MPLKLDGTYGVSGIVGTASSAAMYGADADSGIVFGTNQTTITAGGVGVGTFNTSGLIISGVTTVSVGSTSAPSISPTGDSDTGVFFPAPDTVCIGEGGVEVIRVNSSGNVGIKSSNPAFPLDVNGGNTGSKTVRITSSGSDSALALNNTGSGGREYWIDSGSSGSGVGSGNFAVYDATIGLTRWRIDSSGRVTIPYQPFFYARPTTSGDGQTSNPYTFANVVHNVGNHFVTSGTGAYQRFVAPIDGVYCFQTSPGYKQTSVDWNAYFRINGTTYAEVGRFIGSPSSHSICTGSITLKLSANDYVDVSNQGNAYHNNTTFNFFCGYLLG